jgi:excisionase family DNA binding protein
MTETTTLITMSPDDLEQLIARGVLRALESKAGDGFLDVAGAAAYLACSPEAIRQRVKRGELPTCRLGKRVLFDKADLAAFVRGESA